MLSSTHYHIIPIIILVLFSPCTSNAQPCLDNYQFYNFSTNMCEACPTSCLQCYDRQTCISCVSQYYLDNNKCEPCSFGCAVCTNSTSCSSCILGLYINAEGGCLPCAIGVRSCTIALIDSCKSGYFMLGDICVGCLNNCAQCNDFVTCNLCNNGYYVGFNSTSCDLCSVNCQVCLDRTNCTACAQGYVLSGGSCITPSCSSISIFCLKCANGRCQQCSFGKFVNANGTCSQGASLLCLSAFGTYNTNCQANLYGCPSYAETQVDIVSGNQLPVCLPKRAAQNQQYIFYQNLQSNCAGTGAPSCSTPYSSIYRFKLQKSYYKIEYFISLRLYSTTNQNLSINYLDPASNSTILQFKLHQVNVAQQFSQSLRDASCFNCAYGYTIINGTLTYSGGQNQTVIQVQSLNALFLVNQIILKTSICKVNRCSLCTTAIDCVRCQQPYFLQLISCVQDCDPGFYKYGKTCVLTCPLDAYPIRSSYQCSKCISPCLTCSSVSECLSCADGYFLDGTKCLQICSKPQLFTNLTSKLCEPCPNPCTQCSVTVSTLNSSQWTVSCSGCGVGYLLQQGNCTYICPVGTFSNYINNKTQCSTCSMGCTQCFLSGNICSSCDSSYLLDGNTCFLNYNCLTGYFVNSLKNSCQKCHFPCLTCNLFSRNCTSCLKGALYSNTCPLVCPSQMYITYDIQNSLICRQCIAPCYQCISSTQCLSCVIGTFLYDKKCQSECPVQTYYKNYLNNTCVPCIPPCLKCLSSLQCLSCTTGYIDLSVHRCTLQCNLTSFPNINFVCEQCTFPCIRCYSSVKCLMCSLPYVMNNQECITEAQCSSLNRYVHYYLNYSSIFLNPLSGTCFHCTYPCASCTNSSILCTSCVAGYLFVNDLKICVQQCPQSYFASQTTPQASCLKCHSSCLSCQYTASNCTQCGASMYWYNYTCLLVCPAQFYGSNEQRSCKACTNPCLDCYNAYLCKSCRSGIFYNKACVTTCPAGSIHNTNTNVCDQCTNNCLTCSIVPSNCTQCPTNGFYFYQNQCVSQCPVFYYPDDLSHSCQPCVSPCLQCITSIQCKNCISGNYLFQLTNRCTTVCPEGYFADIFTRKCLVCNLTICRTCSISSNNCTQCALGYYYSQLTQTCVQNCPIGTYADNFYLQCRQCMYPCLVCTATSCLSCISSYKLFQGNCYSSCPLTYYPTINNTCSPCQSTCEICTNFYTCNKCVNGYYVNVFYECVTNCGLGYYNGYDPINSYAKCQICPFQCISCTQFYNCTSCVSNYTLFNGLCLSACPALYFTYAQPSSNSWVCRPCPQFCNRCANQLVCQQCVNSYIYNYQCYVNCPLRTYSYNEQKCIDCVSPCLQCTSQYYCLTCIQGYFYFQNYCVSKCPDDVWKYPENMSCAGECPYNKYSQQMECYVNGCGGMLVHLNGYCLDNCPDGHYVDENQNCISCQSSAQGQSICKKIFMAEIQLLRSYNFRVCIYFNEKTKYEGLDKSRIVTKIEDKTNKNQVILYNPLEVLVDQNLIIISYAYMQMQLYSIQVKIPYMVSAQTSQSIIKNHFRVDINSYNNYQYDELFANMNLNTNRLLAYDPLEYNTIYKPNSIVNVIAIALVAAVFVCMIVNIVCKGTYYRQLLDLLQFVAATIYLQIQYPPILQQYLNNLKICLFSFMPKLANFKPYAFSASKFIEYHKDNSLLRSQGLLFLLFVLILTVFMIMIAVNKYKNNDKLKQIRWLRVVIQRIKYRNITDLFCIVSLPLLIFSFNLKFTNSQIADIIASIVIIILVVGFVILASYILMTAKTLEQIAGLAGQLQTTQNVLGHMYTTFGFIRKIIFCLVLCIQPEKPIATLTILLIFTILIMVCLIFYQPFENQITDYICISMQITFILYVLTIIIIGLNIVDGITAHVTAIISIVVTIIGAVLGLVWLVYLTYGAIKKYRAERSSQVQNEQQNKEQAAQQKPDENDQSMNKDTVLKISHRDVKQSQGRIEQDQPSASQLVKTGNYSNKRKPSNYDRSKEVKISVQDDSEVESNGRQQFRHWNNSQSEDRKSEIDSANQAPKYLLKLQKNKQHEQVQQMSQSVSEEHQE